ncbi:MAG: hypothetical protein AAGH15_28010, partial [Myxococcota bacterium]
FGITGTARAELTQGTVQLERAEGDLRQLTVVLDQLAPPRTHGEELTEFVVWLVEFEGEEEGPPTRLGTLRYDADAASGSFGGTTAAATFVLRITAEVSAEVEAPSDLVIAERRVTPRRPEDRPMRETPPPDGARPPQQGPAQGPLPGRLPPPRR